MFDSYESQIDGLVNETIIGAMCEDISCKNVKEAKEALAYLKQRVNEISLEDIMSCINDDEDEDEF